METGKIFLAGRHRAVRLPPIFHLEGEEVFVVSIGNALVLIPTNNPCEALARW